MESLRFTDPPTTSCWDEPARPVDIDLVARTGRVALEGTSVTIGYQLPVGSFSVEGQPGVIGFADAGGLATGLSYGFLDGTAITARGLVVGEATRASRHSGGVTEAPWFGTDPPTSWTAWAEATAPA